MFAGLAKFEDNLLSQINNQEAIIDTLKGRLEAKDKQARPTVPKLTKTNFKVGYFSLSSHLTPKLFTETLLNNKGYRC